VPLLRPGNLAWPLLFRFWGQNQVCVASMKFHSHCHHPKTSLSLLPADCTWTQTLLSPCSLLLHPHFLTFGTVTLLQSYKPTETGQLLWQTLWPFDLFYTWSIYTWSIVYMIYFTSGNLYCHGLTIRALIRREFVDAVPDLHCAPAHCAACKVHQVQVHPLPQIVQNSSGVPAAVLCSFHVIENVYFLACPWPQFFVSKDIFEWEYCKTGLFFIWLWRCFAIQCLFTWQFSFFFVA